MGSGILGVLIKLLSKMREVNLTAVEKLRDGLIARIDKLHDDGAEAIALHDTERARHEAEMAIMRHRFNNSDQSLNALLLLLKAAPEEGR